VTKLREHYFTSRREIPDDSVIFSRADLPDQNRISRLTPKNNPVYLWQRYFRPLMEKSLHEVGMRNLTFVYGDTHEGGWGELKEDDIRINNCGGWVAHGKDNHPSCHSFAVDIDENEYLLDVSFKTVDVDEKPLLEPDAEEAEH
jgi:hypothetical protein